MLSLGDLFKQKRIEKKFTTSDVARELNVREVLILDLESNDFSKFVSEKHVINLIKIYANFLGINQDKALAIYRRETAKTEKKRDLFSKNGDNVQLLALRVADKLIGLLLMIVRPVNLILLLFIFILIFIFYFLYTQWNNFVRPPEVIILSPSNGDILTEKRFTVSGIAENSSIEISMNGIQATFINDQGEFRIEGEFPSPGLHKFNIIATNQFKQRRIITLELTYVEKQEVNSVNIINNTSDRSEVIISIDDSESEKFVLEPRTNRRISFERKLTIQSSSGIRPDIFLNQYEEKINKNSDYTQIDIYTTPFVLVILK
ncbi:MAG: helix-turn-helix domain-containing protein [Candidatus Dojkabacteria bacterium]|nr:helix-turn-helix domain-containing protein [Candidatus Dojkabacteria bacterium]